MKEKIIKFLKIIGIILIVITGFIILYTAFLFLIKYLNLSIATLILDYIKVLVWPSIIFTLIFVFKSNLSSLLDRIAEFSLPGGVSGKISPQNQQQDVTQEDPINQNEDFNTLLAEKESAIITAQITMEELCQKLGSAELELDLERVYNVIFATQIDLLLKMANFSNVEFEYVNDHFIKAQQSSSGVLNNWTTVQYIQFLITNNLIEYPVGTTVLQITLKGRVFLNYLSVRNYKKYGL